MTLTPDHAARGDEARSDEPTDSLVARPAVGRAPVDAPAAGYVGALIALVLLGAGAVALRDAVVDVGWLRGIPWTSTVISGLDGLTYHGWMLPVGVVAILLGLWSMSAALRPRRRSALAVPAQTSVWIGKADLARLATTAADTVSGVLTSRASAGLRTVTVRAEVTAGSDPALKAAITTAIAEAINGFTAATPRIKVRTRSGEH